MVVEVGSTTDPVVVSVEVTNTGGRDGDEVAEFRQREIVATRVQIG